MRLFVTSLTVLNYSRTLILWGERGNVVSMLTRLRFKRLQSCALGCNQVRIIPRPLHRPGKYGDMEELVTEDKVKPFKSGLFKWPIGGIELPGGNVPGNLRPESSPDCKNPPSV